METIKTFNDLLAVGESESARIQFALTAISEHQSSDDYRTAKDAAQYYNHINPTIMNAQKWIYNALGQKVPDKWAANNKIACRYYFYFVTQSIQYLLGNGVSFSDAATKEKLGKNFDQQMQKLATFAKNSKVGFAFVNLDHIDVFDYLEFVPLYDEDTGALRAGIRFWQIADDKPLMFTLYEEDGLTDFKRSKDGDVQIIRPKHAYKQIVNTTAAGGEEVVAGENYPSFPIVPLYNISKQSELVGNQGTIDAYDLMASALVNNIDDGNLIYWVIKNCGGMDLDDDAKFIEQLKTTHVVHADGDEGAAVDAHTIEAPFEANENALERLRSQLFDDFMALDVTKISAGSTTATQIRSAYEPLNSKTDAFESEVTTCIQGILDILGIDDTPTYTRSKIVNVQEEIQTVLSAADYLSTDYVTRKILTLLGDIDKADDVIAQAQGEELSRFAPTFDGGNNQNEAE